MSSRAKRTPSSQKVGCESGSSGKLPWKTCVRRGRPEKWILVKPSPFTRLSVKVDVCAIGMLICCFWEGELVQPLEKIIVLYRTEEDV